MLNNNAPYHAKNALLGELESIQSALNEEQPNLLIPTLSDVIPAEEKTAHPDINTIQDDRDDLATNDIKRSLETKNNGLNLDHLDSDIVFPDFNLISTSSEQPDEEQVEMFPSSDNSVLETRPQTARQQKPESPPSVSMDQLIEQLVAETLPLLEFELRQRLQSYSPEVLEELLAVPSKA